MKKHYGEPELLTLKLQLNADVADTLSFGGNAGNDGDWTNPDNDDDDDKI